MAQKLVWPARRTACEHGSFIGEGAGLDMILFPGPIAFRLLPESLRVGDIVVFDGDVVHRGIEYDHENVSVHAPCISGCGRRDACCEKYLVVQGVRRVVRYDRLGSFMLVREGVGLKY